jgi:DNA topoisomerase I
MKGRRALPLDPVQSARLAGLRYNSVDGDGIRRRKLGKGWIFTGADGRRITDEKEIRRINALVIPPAWTDVWIAPHAACHLQAVGYDARGRKQYRYHAAFRELRDSTKFARMPDFAAALPRLRHSVEKDLQARRLTKNKVLATVVRLLDLTAIRIGNNEYAKANDSFGLTTLVDDHVAVQGSKVTFRFKGKSGVDHSVDIRDRRLAKVVRECQEIPGQDLFQYLDENGNSHRIRSEDVNAYIREISGGEFTAKDFRTWNGTRVALTALRNMATQESDRPAKTATVIAVKQVAEVLGNRPATCRKFYIHPAILAAYENGVDFSETPPSDGGLSPDEGTMIFVISKWRS